MFSLGFWSWSWELCRVCVAALADLFWFMCLYLCLCLLVFCRLSLSLVCHLQPLFPIVSSEMFLPLQVVASVTTSFPFPVSASACLYACWTFLKWHRNSATFLDISLSLFFPTPSAFFHSSLVWKQERALFEQYYSCPLWLWSHSGHQSVPPLASRTEKALLQSNSKE